ncbi:MAG: 1-(5-phosphoribosyl)-5-[(5-phosphoribosylamino)methylideneamino]imidazole-4-carboxamide isomerase [Thermodesulfobacteriota bacterium]
MLVIPAIDLKAGRCVRLTQGRFDLETVYSEDPAAVARQFERIGAEWIHLVDLDGSKGQKPINQEIILAIRSAVAAKLELGGGIRDLETISYYLKRGLDRIILGTAAWRDPDLVLQAARLFPGRIAVGLDARGGKIVVEGWTEETDKDYLVLAGGFKDLNLAALIYTDVERDGTRRGPNLERTRDLARTVRLPVIASGGVKDLEDIKALIPLEKDGVIGVITGRAVYEGSLDLAAALELTTGAKATGPPKNN